MRARELISLQLDTQLVVFDSAWLFAHIRACPECRDYRYELAAITAHLRAVTLELPQRDFTLCRHQPAAARVAAVVAAAAILAAISALVVDGAHRQEPPRNAVVSRTSVEDSAQSPAQQRLLALLTVLDAAPVAPSGGLIAI